MSYFLGSFLTAADPAPAGRGAAWKSRLEEDFFVVISDIVCIGYPAQMLV